jgi:putative ABC transport system permease protein
MNKVTLKGLGFRRSRTILTAVAIVIGVSMISGVYVLTDTISSAFDSIFSSSYSSANAVISGKSVVSSSMSGSATVPASLVRRVEKLPDVATASGAIFDTSGMGDKAQLLDKQGNAISSGGAPNFGFGFDPTQSQFDPMKLSEGHFATNSHQVVIDKGTADSYGFGVGDRIGVAAVGPTRDFAVSGIARFGSVDSLGGATIAVFDVPTAQALLDKRGQFDVVFLAAQPGVSNSKLVSEVRPLLPSSAKVQTAAQKASSQSKDTQSALKFIRYFLLAFAGIAVLVGAFVTFNTISITVAQRIREFATLRALGAKRRQVLRSVLIEGFCIGLLASVVGLIAGVALAKGLNALFTALGLSLPTTGTVFKTRTAVVALCVGVGVTVVSSIVPALRATRIPPVSAMREGATLPPSRISSRRGLVVIALAIVAGALLVYGSFGSLGTLASLEVIGAGCVALFFAVGIGASKAVAPVVAAVGAPSRHLGGEAGRLASANATRNPIRTARTASALMIGLALVTVVATLGAALRDSDRNALNQTVSSDYVVTSKNGFDTFPRAAGDAVAQAPGVTLASAVRQDSAKTNGGDVTVDGVGAGFARVFNLTWSQGSDRVLNQLGANGAVIQKSFADDHDLSLGDTFAIRTPSGERLVVRVRGIQSPANVQKIDPLVGKVLISTAAFDRSFPRPANQFSFVDMRGGATPANTAALEQSLRQFSSAKLATKADWVSTRSGELNKLLNLLYVLLALSVVVSLFGMVNTLVLSVFERTREIGMLRAVGMKRRQVRRMIRQESVITALIGAGLGLPLGLLLAAVLIKALSSEGVTYSVPVTSLVAFTLVAVVAGIGAAVLPARRAAGLDVLDALHYE